MLLLCELNADKKPCVCVMLFSLLVLKFILKSNRVCAGFESSITQQWLLALIFRFICLVQVVAGCRIFIFFWSSGAGSAKRSDAPLPAVSNDIARASGFSRTSRRSLFLAGPGCWSPCRDTRVLTHSRRSHTAAYRSIMENSFWRDAATWGWQTNRSKRSPKPDVAYGFLLHPACLPSFS